MNGKGTGTEKNTLGVCKRLNAIKGGKHGR